MSYATFVRTPRPSRAIARVAPLRKASPIAIQAKLELGAAGNAFEREADRVADAVMREPSATALSVGGQPPGGDPAAQVQCACDACYTADRDDERREPLAGGKRSADDESEGGGKRIFRKRERTAAPEPGADVAVSALSEGAPMPQSEIEFFDRRLGFDFSAVRIHSDDRAADAAKTIHARAFTYGRDIAFAQGEYRPGTSAGRHLLAHELTHVVQQAGAATGAVQRDLATPAPAVAPPAQTDLTQPQIDEARRFNAARFNAVHTRQIQDLVGTTPTGTWKDEDIVAIALLQENYGLTKDGKVGPSTFRFLDRETRAEKIATTDKNCLVSFNVNVHPVAVTAPSAGKRKVTGSFDVHALLPSYCNCADYEYRQLIRGHARHEHGGVATDRSGDFTALPHGPLTAGFLEDGDTTDATAAHYGHRAEGAEGAFNQYSDATGAADQANGCTYDNTDHPGLTYTSAAGDVLDMEIQFQGEIRRKGKVVHSRVWTAIRGRFVTP